METEENHLPRRRQDCNKQNFKQALLAAKTKIHTKKTCQSTCFYDLPPL